MRRGQTLGGRSVLSVALGMSMVVALSGQQQPRFRSATSVLNVPVDVRVVDADGHPVRDLRPEDFVVLEDGEPQTITHFSSVTFDARPASHAATPAAASVDALAVPHRTLVVGYFQSRSSQSSES
jgi:hypothetical protein